MVIENSLASLKINIFFCILLHQTVLTVEKYTYLNPPVLAIYSLTQKLSTERTDSFTPTKNS